MEVIVDTGSGVFREHIVRCRDCKKWTDGDGVNGICQWNEHRTLQTRADSFCSFGEERSER